MYYSSDKTKSSNYFSQKRFMLHHYHGFIKNTWFLFDQNPLWYAATKQ